MNMMTVWRRWLVVGLSTLLLSVVVLPAMVPSVVDAVYTKKTLNFDSNSTLKNGTQLGSSKEDPVGGLSGGPIQVASQIVNVLLTTLGLFCFAVTVYGGYIWMMARGNEEEVKRAKDIITGTVTGLLFILASYGIMNYVFRSVVNFTN